MVYINANISKANDYISQYKSYKNQFYEDVVSNHNILSSVDSCWNDFNSLQFKDIIRNNNIKILDYFESFDLLVKELERFNGDLSYSLSSLGYTNKSKLSLRFNNNRIDSCVSKLTNTVSYLNDAVYVINKNLINSNYSNKAEVYELREKIYSIINDINNIKNNIIKFNASVSNTISLYNTNIKKIDGLDLRLVEPEYRGNLVDLSD